MKRYFPGKLRSPRAFTLIEVVLSLAIVALAVIAIMGLLDVFIQGTKTVIERNEALSICQALNAYLQMPEPSTTASTSVPTQGFDKVYGWIQSGKIPPLYAFVIPVQTSGNYDSSGGIPQMQVTASTDANFANINNRIGRLYYISLTLSPNVPIHLGVSRTATYNPSSLPATFYPRGFNDNSFYADCSLSLSVRVYAVPAVTGLTATQLENDFNYPILMYDTAVNR
jgi:type II secretory pathway pseudopilin PulG